MSSKVPEHDVSGDGSSERGPPLVGLDDAERDFIRQSERTVDNLKRLSAFVFAISFTVAGLGVVQKMLPILTVPAEEMPPFLVWWVNAEMLLAFTVTAALFFYQADKFLDNHLARHPIEEPRPWRIAERYGVLVATMLPFYLMAHSMAKDVTDRVGFTWFFAGYVLLLGSGLFLLAGSVLLNGLRRLRGVAESLAEDQVLRAFWMMMNSVVLALNIAAFWVARISGERCPPLGKGHEVPWFLVVFGGLVLIRDCIDYRWAFRFHYPLREPKKLDLWPIASMSKSGKLWPCYAAALVAGVLIAAMVHDLALLDIGYWVAACQVATPSRSP